MNTTAKVGIGALLAVAAGLAITLGVVLARGDANGSDDSSYGMMGRVQSRDWLQMQGYMRGIIGDAAYGQMLGQMRQQCGSNWSGQQMLDYMRGILSPDAYNTMVAYMRQAWGEDWQNEMPMAWGMMGCWN